MTLLDAGAATRPTTLKPVIDVIPPRCYERSTLRGLGLIGRDFVIYALAVAGLLVTDRWYVLVPLWVVAGLAVSGLFVLGHDAAHGALFDSRRLNAVVARMTMLPSLHATEVWVFGHNRVHHGHTLRQGMDFVWHPTSPEEWALMGRVARAVHRLEWSRFGAGVYYAHRVWFDKMVRFSPPARWRRQMRVDQLLVVGFAVAALAVLIATHGLAGGVWAWVKVVVVPFVLFCQVIGWVVYVHHIDAATRWWPRREWNKFRGQVEGTTVLWGPPGWDLFFHWIMVHLPHHVDMRIPCYRLPEAARAIAAAFPDEVIERPIRPGDYFAAVRACKLHDFETGTWHRYP